MAFYWFSVSSFVGVVQLNQHAVSISLFKYGIQHRNQLTIRNILKKRFKASKYKLKAPMNPISAAITPSILLIIQHIPKICSSTLSFFMICWVSYKMNPLNMTTEKAAMARSTFALKGRKIWTSPAVRRPHIPANKNGPKEEKSYCVIISDYLRWTELDGMKERMISVEWWKRGLDGVLVSTIQGM